MKIIQGIYNIAKVMIDEIDETTQEQIQTFLNHPAFSKKRIVIMPDCHAGNGSCIGFTMQLGDYIMPQVVGVDIGCGMLAVNFGVREVDPSELDTFIKSSIPSGHEINDEPYKDMEDVKCICKIIDTEYRKVLRAVGSLGGGNHFIEADKDEDNNLWIVIHSGSRNFGKRVADYYQSQARKLLKQFFIEPQLDMEFIPISCSLAQDYLVAMQVAQRYASVNRYEMMRRIADFIGGCAQDVVQSVHNYIDFEDNIIRKGAIRAHDGERCIIPFNSAEGSVICRGKGNKDWNYSAPHGAGRLMSRSKAFDTLDYKVYQAILANNNVYSTTANSSTIDEAPMAYKPADMILTAIEPTVEIIKRLKPFYNFKAAEGRHRRENKGESNE